MPHLFSPVEKRCHTYRSDFFNGLPRTYLVMAGLMIAEIPREDHEPRPAPWRMCARVVGLWGSRLSLQSRIANIPKGCARATVRDPESPQSRAAASTRSTDMRGDRRERMVLSLERKGRRHLK